MSEEKNFFGEGEPEFKGKAVWESNHRPISTWLGKAAGKILSFGQSLFSPHEHAKLDQDSFKERQYAIVWLNVSLEIITKSLDEGRLEDVDKAKNTYVKRIHQYRKAYDPESDFTADARLGMALDYFIVNAESPFTLHKLETPNQIIEFVEDQREQPIYPPSEIVEEFRQIIEGHIAS